MTSLREKEDSLADRMVISQSSMVTLPDEIAVAVAYAKAHAREDIDALLG
jgi:hypothetical protein